MIEVVIMTEAEAFTLAAATDEETALDPRQMLDGRWCLPSRVVDDPAHAMHRALLLACPRELIDPATAFPVGED